MLGLKDKRISRYIFGGVIALICLFQFYFPISGQTSVQASLSNPSTQSISIIEKYFPEDQGKLQQSLNNKYISSPTAKYWVDLDKQMVTEVVYTNVKRIGKSTKISKDQAKKIAYSFANEHFPQFDTTSCQEQIGDHSCYVIVLNEVDKNSGIKLLDKFTAIISKETGQISMTMMRIVPGNLPSVKISKNKAQIIATDVINKEFSEAKLVSSSESPQVKLDSENNQQVGWIFIFESSDHSGAVLVDVTNGDAFYQCAY
ncbi:MAG: hypothetical protein U9N81_08025 [Bacillota bacterium]|nr:hypothetical protein [Bacillota bacterium]